MITSICYKSSMENIEQQLRKAVQLALDKGWTISSIAKAAGVSRSGLRDWWSQYRPVKLNLETTGKLCEWLACRLTKPKIPKHE